MLFRYLYFDPFKFKKNSNSFGFQTPRKKTLPKSHSKNYCF